MESEFNYDHEDDGDYDGSDSEDSDVFEYDCASENIIEPNFEANEFDPQTLEVPLTVPDPYN